MNNNKIIIWSPEIADLIDGRPIGGIAVQMYFWAQTFTSHGWQVMALIKDGGKTIEKEGLILKPRKNIKHLNLLLDWWYALKYIISIRPNFIFYRGANREVLPIAVLTRLFRIKLVFFAASDVNFEPGKELVGSESNRRMYQHSIRCIKYFIVQNQHQHDTLLDNYGKESIILYNIWGKTKMQDLSSCSYDVVWLANFRRLKRAEWVLNMARTLPEYRFAMAGANADDKSYYEEMKNCAGSLNNVDFLGGQSFSCANSLVANSRLLLCTSTFEGFPNTFLQAWSNGLPVVSTVDPSNIISDHKLGIVVQTEDELKIAIKKILNDEDYYNELRQSVATFFKENHSSETGYIKLISYIS